MKVQRGCPNTRRFCVGADDFVHPLPHRDVPDKHSLLFTEASYQYRHRPMTSAVTAGRECSRVSMSWNLAGNLSTGNSLSMMTSSTLPSLSSTLNQHQQQHKQQHLQQHKHKHHYHHQHHHRHHSSSKISPNPCRQLAIVTAHTIVVCGAFFGLDLIMENNKLRVHC